MWLRYVDVTMAQHGEDQLKMFLKYPNEIHTNVQFTMDTGENEQLPFLDVLVKK